MLFFQVVGIVSVALLLIIIILNQLWRKTPAVKSSRIWKTSGARRGMICSEMSDFRLMVLRSLTLSPGSAYAWVDF